MNIDVASGVVRLPGHCRVALAGRLCRQRGYLLPLPRPLPGCTVATLCARLPYIVDAYVTGIEATLSSGATLSVPHRPRGAVGPDLLGLVCQPATAASLRWVTLRLTAYTEATAEERRYESIDEAAATIVARVTEGRAFAVVAYRVAAGVVVRCLGGDGLSSPPLDTVDVARRWRWERGAGASSRNLRPGDHDAVAASLAAGEMVHAAPFVGRIASLSLSTWPAIEHEPWELSALWAGKGRAHE